MTTQTDEKEYSINHDADALTITITATNARVYSILLDEVQRSASRLDDTARNEMEDRKRQQTLSTKNAISDSIYDFFERDDIMLKVWLKNGDKRIYLNNNNEQFQVTYYHTGNRWHCPSEVAFANAPAYAVNNKEALVKLFETICKQYNAFNLLCDYATDETRANVKARIAERQAKPKSV